jgi:hypothetical protein
MSKYLNEIYLPFFIFCVIITHQNIKKSALEPSQAKSKSRTLPESIPPVSGKEIIDEPTRQARKDIQAILTDAKRNKRSWPIMPESTQKMSLPEIVQRIKELNEREEQILWKIELADEQIQHAKNATRRKKAQDKKVELLGDKLDINRLRRSFGLQVKSREDVRKQKDNMILTEDSPVDSKDKPGYVYMGRYNDKELWIRDEKPQLQIIKNRLAS